MRCSCERFARNICAIMFFNTKDITFGNKDQLFAKPRLYRNTRYLIGRIFVGRNFRRAKLFVGRNFRHFSKNSSLSPNKVSPDKVRQKECRKSLSFIPTQTIQWPKKETFSNRGRLLIERQLNKATKAVYHGQSV